MTTETMLMQVFPTGLPDALIPDDPVGDGGEPPPVDPSERDSDDDGMPEQPSRQEMDAKIEAAVAGIRSDIAAMRQSFAEDRTAHVKWAVGLGVAFTTITVAVLSTQINGLKPAAGAFPAAPAPTIIYVSPPAPATPPSPAASR